MLSLAEPPKSCRHHDTLSSNHLSVEGGGVLRLGLWVRGLRNPIVLVYQLFCHLQTFFFFQSWCQGNHDHILSFS